MTLKDAVEHLKQGGVLVYPTETYYAVGCMARNAEAVARVFAVKNRPHGKPLPVVVGDVSQLPLAVRVEPAYQAGFKKLAATFWPGPLSIVLPGCGDLPQILTGKAGSVAIRVTPHPLARELCLQTGAALVATSANISGNDPATRPHQIDKDLLKADVDVRILDQLPWPPGGAPSTLVRFTSAESLLILREGAVQKAVLAQAGFDVDVA